jgi:tRNA dimethylallyltransferase
MNPKYLISVVGPTAIGKTSLSIALTKHYKTEIISCDSRQFYKEMTIGTAVPDEEELKQARHHFIQNRSVFEDYSVGDFEKDALRTLDTIFKKHNIAVMVGGSGLYADAVIKGLDDFPEVDPQIRTELKTELKEKGIVPLQELLKELDPVSYDRIDIENHQRLIRALEICKGTGKPYSSFLKKKENKRNFTPVKIGLTADREIIYNRINQRVDLMTEHGLLQEAKALFPHKELNALQTVGYRELFKYLEGEFTLDFAVSEIKKNTRRFAKRQITWFKKDTEIKWFDYQTDISSIIEYINKQLDL